MGLDFGSPNPWASRGWQRRRGESLLQLEVDVHGVAVAGAEAGGRGIDFCDAPEGGLHGLIHDRVAAGFHDLRAFDGAVAGDVNFDGADERFVLLEDGGWLLPLAEKAVVDEVVIPTEFARCAAAAGFCGGAGSRCGRAWALGFGEGFFLRVLGGGVGFLFCGWRGFGFWRGLRGGFWGRLGRCFR